MAQIPVAPMNYPSVFISYAHGDGLDFVRQLAFALGFYTDVFYDRHIESGPYPEQLYEQIRSSTHFLLVMTPFSLREDGWCMKELACAEQYHREGICLAKRYHAIQPPEIERALSETYTYGDFT